MSKNIMKPMLFAMLLSLGLVSGARAELTAITNATIHTLGPQGSLRNASLLIDGKRIRAVGQNIDIPKSAKVIDAGGKVVTPGVFEAVSQLGIVEITYIKDTVDSKLEADSHGPAFSVADAFNPDSTLIDINRIEGITRAMIAPQNGKSIFAGQGSLVHLGDAGDYLSRADAALFVSLGEAGAKLAGQARGGAVLRLREALEDARDYRDHRKAFREGERYAYALSRKDLDALSGVLDGKIPLAVQVERASDIRGALRLKREFELNMVLVGASEGWKVAAEIAAARVPVVINPVYNVPRSFESLGATLQNAARLHKAGVMLSFDYDRTHNARNLTQAAGIAAAHGLPWIEALKAITLNPAKLWGMDERVGSLQAGKDADVVIWNGDPLEVTTYAEHVFIRGEAVPMVSRQTLLRDRYWELSEGMPYAYR